MPAFCCQLTVQLAGLAEIEASTRGTEHFLRGLKEFDLYLNVEA